MLVSSAAIRLQVESALSKKIPSALTVRERPHVEVFSSGIGEVDALLLQQTGVSGIPRGALTEICGAASSGRTSLMISLLAQVTRKQEACAIIDASDAFHPASAEAAGVELARVLWVRCGREEKKVVRKKSYPIKTGAYSRNSESLKRVEQALKATDLLLQSGGFGLVVVDLGDIAVHVARRVPLTSWFRFRRAVENTPTALLVLEQEPHAKTCAQLVLQLKAKNSFWSSDLLSHAKNEQKYCATVAKLAHTNLFRGFEIQTEITRASGSMGKKPPGNAVASYETRTRWEEYRGA